jgi:FkbM family methyltransferase
MIDPRPAIRRLRGARVQRRLAGPKLLRAFAAAYEHPFFVEIGANDGDQHDHLRELILAHSWAGLMVEPVPYVFERLVANYRGHHQVMLENAAISDRDGPMPFYYLAEVPKGREAELPDWYHGIGSFSREAVLSHRRVIPEIEEHVVETTVPTLRFDSLCEKHGVERVDLLVVDTEGHDAEILAAIDFARWLPALVVYEHFHLDPGDRAGSRSALEQLGYETFEEGFDTWCLSAGAERSLRRVWERLEPAVPGLSAADER